MEFSFTFCLVQEAAAAKRKAAAAEKADITAQRKQRYDTLKEKQIAQGQLQGAESKEYQKLQSGINGKKRNDEQKRRREEESPEAREERLKKRRKEGGRGAQKAGSFFRYR